MLSMSPTDSTRMMLLAAKQMGIQIDGKPGDPTHIDPTSQPATQPSTAPVEPQDHSFLSQGAIDQLQYQRDSDRAREVVAQLEAGEKARYGTQPPGR
ncbi:MAG TPA: hypothetical protein VGO93_31580 [Candidatus Xenobia bacterium]|jgi:hypothetical protein